MHGWQDVLKVKYNDPHKFVSKLPGFPFALRTNHAISRQICVDQLYSTFKTSFQPYAFYKNGYKRFSKTKLTDPRQSVPLELHVKCSAEHSVFLLRIYS